MTLHKRLSLLMTAGFLWTSMAAEAAPTFVNILTGGTSGVYYPLGVGLSQIYGQQIAEVKFSVQATKASVENLNLLQNGRGEVAFALADSVAPWRACTPTTSRSSPARPRGFIPWPI
jgi:TRAP transporter TAXI family solute receptor